MNGVINVASPKDLEMILEGERVGGEMSIHTTTLDDLMGAHEILAVKEENERRAFEASQRDY